MYWLAAARDSVSAGWCKMPQNSMRNHIHSDIGLTNPFDYFNAGVLVMNLEELSKVTSTEELFSLAEKENKWTWMDQDILNYICKGHVKFLGQEWNLMVNANIHHEIVTPIGFAPKWLQDDYSNAHKAPKLIHYAGGTHPCYRPGEDFPDVFWGYARKTPFYEDLIKIRKLEKDQKETNYRLRMKKRVMPFINNFAPKGSLMRTWIKWIYHGMRG
jgi:lipopolysaccharide biosynthesis glycosyltransferase